MIPYGCLDLYAEYKYMPIYETEGSSGKLTQATVPLVVQHKIPARVNLSLVVPGLEFDWLTKVFQKSRVRISVLVEYGDSGERGGGSCRTIALFTAHPAVQ